MTAATSPLALAQDFLADVDTIEALPGNETLSRHLSQAALDLENFSDLDAALMSLGHALSLAAEAPPAQAKGRGALPRHLAAVAQRQRLGMLAQVARVLVLDAMKGAQA